LKNEVHEREKIWCTLWAQRKGHDPHPDDFSQMPHPSLRLSSSQSHPLPSPVSLSHVSQYPDQIDTSATYTFALNRPLSPSASTTSSSSSTMTSPFQFPFPENPVPNDRSDFNFRRHSTNGAELTLHGRTAHILVMGNDERYQMAAPRRRTAKQSHTITPPTTMFHGGQQTHVHDPRHPPGPLSVRRSRLSRRRLLVSV